MATAADAAESTARILPPTKTAPLRRDRPAA